MSWVGGVYVVPAARGQGLSKMLLRALLRGRGYHDLEQITLAVSRTQRAARQLYRFMGMVLHLKEVEVSRSVRPNPSPGLLFVGQLDGRQIGRPLDSGGIPIGDGVDVGLSEANL